MGIWEALSRVLNLRTAIIVIGSSVVASLLMTSALADRVGAPHLTFLWGAFLFCTLVYLAVVLFIVRALMRDGGSVGATQRHNLNEGPMMVWPQIVRRWRGLGFGSSATYAMAVALSLLGLFVVGLFWTLPKAYPSKSELETVKGKVDKVDMQHWRVVFRIKGREEIFHYSQKSGEMSRVGRAIESAQEVEVGVAREERGSRRVVTVLSVRADGVVVRSEQDVARAWMEDNWNMRWIGAPLAMALFGTLAAVLFALARVK